MLYFTTYVAAEINTQCIRLLPEEERIALQYRSLLPVAILIEVFASTHRFGGIFGSICQNLKGAHLPTQ